MSIRLPDALAAWNTPAFERVLRSEIERFDAARLPLQQGLTRSSCVSGDRFQATILTVDATHDNILVKAGIHYTGIITGCSCADDPTPLDELAEYCEVLIRLDKSTAAATIVLIDD